MKTKRALVHTLSGLLVAGGLIWEAQFAVNATAPSGLSFAPVARATVPEFTVKRKDLTIQWRIDLEADQPIDVATQIVTFQPGGHSGWHTHPGPVLFTVRTGTLTVYEGEDPSCTANVFQAGTGAVEAGTTTHSHLVRNETNSIAEAVVTYLVPVGANPLRTDQPNPGNCPF